MALEIKMAGWHIGRKIPAGKNQKGGGARVPYPPEHLVPRRQRG